MNIWMGGEMHKAGCGRVPVAAASVAVELGVSTLPGCGHAHQLRSSLNPVVLGVLGSSPT